jgi:uncharacterized protein (TIGR02757 family)
MPTNSFAHNADLKSFLDQKFEEYNTPGFILNDPISIPHRFTRKEDIEIAGFLAATLSWGQRITIVNNSDRLLRLMDSTPFEFLTQSDEREFSRFLSFVHRTFNGEDCIFLMHALRNLYSDHGGMEAVFYSGYHPEMAMLGAITSFRKTMLLSRHLPRSAKHIAAPLLGSAGKRINMFLRWMVRNDGKGVDFGIWKSFDPAHLMCPLDVHSGRIARKLGLLNRKQDDWKAVEELTANLRTFDPSDPVKYDYALFGLGVFEKY